MIQAAHPLTVTRRCELLDVARSTVYYHPTGIPAEDLALMRLLDEIHLERPFYGSRRVPAGRARCASCISVVVFPRPAGPSRTMRQLCDSAWSICSSDSTSADSAPSESSLTAVRSTSGWPFVFPARSCVRIRLGMPPMVSATVSAMTARFVRPGIRTSTGTGREMTLEDGTPGPWY